jgi:uncharacterized protein (DUF924 family)
MEDKWAESVTAFWFGTLSPQQWFRSDEALDRTIRDRFHGLYQSLKSSVPAVARTDPNSALAAIIVLDQFPRNMFRGRPEAFETDPIACSLARNAIDKGLDGGLSVDERRFVFMPLMHSEVLADQERCVLLFKSLGDENSLRYAVEHRDIIARFGRFPHRNRVLGRESTDAEIAYLEDANTYGQ